MTAHGVALVVLAVVELVAAGVLAYGVGETTRKR